MVDGKKETIYAFIYTGLSKIVTYALVFVFANYYLAEEYGLGNFVLNWRTIAAIFCCIGLIDGLVPFVVKKKKINSILISLITLSLIFVFIGLIVSIKYPFIWPFVITIPFSLFSNIGLAFWRSKSKYGKANLIILIGITLTLVFAYLLKSYGAFGLIISYSLGYFFSSILIIYPIRKEVYSSLKGKFDFEQLKYYLKQGIPITYISNLFTLIASLDSVILGLTGNFKAVAQFGVASAISGVISIIPLTLSLFLITRTGEVNEKEKSLRIFHRTVRVSFFISLIISALLVICTPFILNIFFNSYTDVALYILILNLGMIFFSSYYIIYSYYIGKIESHKAIIPVTAGLIVNIVLSFITVFKFGIIGICIANAIGHFVTLILMSRKEQIKKVMIMSIFSLIIIPIIYYLGLFGIIVGLLLVPVSLVLKIITKEDITIIKESFYKIIKRN